MGEHSSQNNTNIQKNTENKNLIISKLLPEQGA
jgi:hypothetical protein